MVMLERIMIPLAGAVRKGEKTPKKAGRYTRRAEAIDRSRNLTEELGLNVREGNFARTYIGYKVFERDCEPKKANLREEMNHGEAKAEGLKADSVGNVLLFRPMLAERRKKYGELITRDALFKAGVDNAFGQIVEESGEDRARMIRGALDEIMPLYFERRSFLFRREKARIADAKIEDSVHKWRSRLEGRSESPLG